MATISRIRVNLSAPAPAPASDRFIIAALALYTMGGFGIPALFAWAISRHLAGV